MFSFARLDTTCSHGICKKKKTTVCAYWMRFDSSMSTVYYIRQSSILMLYGPCVVCMFLIYVVYNSKSSIAHTSINAVVWRLHQNSIQYTCHDPKIRHDIYIYYALLRSWFIFFDVKMEHSGSIQSVEHSVSYQSHNVRSNIHI